MVSVENWNKTFKKYPITVEDKGWIYGVWYCGTAWAKVRLHGQYPPGFLKRALALFPDVPEDKIIHVPCGTLTGPGMTVDMIRDEVRQPQVQASADSLPFADNSYRLFLSDPPYTPKDSEIYGCPPFSLGKMMKEAHRILEPGGVLGILHTYYPSYRRQEWELIGLIAVVTGFQRATRMFSLFRSKKEPPCR